MEVPCTQVQPVVTGDAALTRLVEERGQWLLGCAYLLTRDRERALDLSQDTLLQAWRAWEKVGAADRPDAYLLRVMLNLHRSSFRRRRVREVSLVGLEPLPSYDATGAVDDLDSVSRAMAHVSERQRAVLVLRYWADRDDADIAEILGCRRSTVRSLAARGLAIIEKHLAEDS